jgi:hypothetical protein
MKKLLVAVLAFALFAPAFAVENVKLTGDIQTIGFVSEDHGVALTTLPALTFPNTKFTSNRVILGFTADLVDDVTAKVTFAHQNVFGDDTYSGAGIFGAPISESSDNGLLERTYLTEAFVKVSNIFDALEVKVGRQFYGDEKSAVLYLGPTYGYADPKSPFMGAGVAPLLSVEGVTAVYRGENYALTAAYFSLDHDGTTLDAADDFNLGGLDLTGKLNENISGSVYVYDFRARDDNDGFGFWGVKPTLDYEHFKLGVEYAQNYGAYNDKGWQVKADLALPLGTEETSVTPRVTYLKSEKHFQALGNYRPGLMFGTLLGIGVNNVIGGPAMNWEIFNAGLCMKFAGLEKWAFGLDFYTKEIDGAWEGNSWEAKVVYNVNQYVALNLTGAVLSNIKHFTGSPFAAQLGMNIKF